jgi:hypothetical protein
LAAFGLRVVIFSREVDMSISYYIPRGDSVFLGWANRFMTNLFPSIERFEFPLETYSMLEGLLDCYTSTLAIATNQMTRTVGTVADKNDARKKLESEIRLAVKRFLIANPHVSNKDREDIGLPVYKTTHTPIPVPTTLVKTKVSWPTPGVVEIAFRDSEAEGRAKPYGVHGAELVYGILPAPPKQWNELTHSVIDTRSPIRLSFENDQRCQTIYFAIRWEGSRGDKGPWSDIQSTTIP